MRMPESRVFLAALIMGLAAVAYGQSPNVDAGNLTSEVTALKTENIALREQLNRVEEQQKMMLELVNDLKQRLGSPATPIVGGPSSSSQQNFAAARELAMSVTDIAAPRAPVAQPQSVSALQAIENRYRDGIIIREAPEGAEVPFLLRLQGTTQVRYINTIDSQNTFTDHLGKTYNVDKRNDITVNRSMMVFGGYVFNLKTTGYATGTYRLDFQASGDPVTHSVQFQVK